MVQLLVQNGHSRKDVYDMTLTQIRMFAASITKLHLSARMEYVVDTAMAAQGDSKGLKKHLKILERTYKSLGT